MDLKPTEADLRGIHAISGQRAVEIDRLAIENEKLREALAPFAKISERRELGGLCAAGDMYITVALMNGNVTQSVMHSVLKVSDFRNAAEAISVPNPAL